jgi:hypothetical protein
MRKFRIFAISVLLAFIIVPAIFAATTMMSGTMSDGATLGLSIGLVALTSLVTWLGGKSGPFGKTVGALLRSLQSNFISYDKVDEAANNVLTSIGVPAPFAAWVAEILAKILTTVPLPFVGADLNRSGPWPKGKPMPEQVVDIVASAFARLPVKQANILVNDKIPANVMDATFARKRVAVAMLRSMYKVV